MFKLISKKIMTLLQKKLLNWPYESLEQTVWLIDGIPECSLVTIFLGNFKIYLSSHCVE